MVKNRFLRTLLFAGSSFLIYLFFSLFSTDFILPIGTVLGIFSFVMFLIYDFWGEKFEIVKMYAGIGVIILAFTLGLSGMNDLVEECKNGFNVFNIAKNGIPFHYFFVTLVIFFRYLNKNNRGFSYLIPLFALIISFIITILFAGVYCLLEYKKIFLYVPVPIYAIFILRTIFRSTPKDAVVAKTNKNYDPTSWSVKSALQKLDIFKKYTCGLEFEYPKDKRITYQFIVYGAKFKIEDQTITITGKYQDNKNMPKGYVLPIGEFSGYSTAINYIENEVKEAADAAAEGKRTYSVYCELTEDTGPKTDFD